MVARIPARGDAAVKVFGLKLTAQAQHRQPRPAPEMVFTMERRPRGGEGNGVHFRPEARTQFLGEGFGQQGDGEFFRCGPEKGRGDDQIAETPKFENEQFGFHDERQAVCGRGSGLRVVAGSRCGPRTPQLRAMLKAATLANPPTSF